MPGFPTPIEHIVVLMFENRSFDHMFGCRYDWPEGLLNAPEGQPWANLDPLNGLAHTPTCDADFYDLFEDPGHEPADVHAQLEEGSLGSAPAGSKNLGFVQNFRDKHPQATDAGRIMRCFDRGKFVAFSTLADHFTVCSQWYSSVPGPTWPNRFFLHTGTSGGMSESFTKQEIIDATLLGIDFPDSLFAAVERARLTWKVYEFHVSQSRSIRPLHAPGVTPPPGMDDFDAFDQFDRDCQSGNLPNYCFIEPDWIGRNQNDMHPHPGGDIRLGDELLATVYNTLRTGPAWSKTLLIVLFDEHGGTYDHCYPPSAVVPDESLPENPLVPFDRLGVRVPAILVSPYSPAGLSKVQYDHTAVAASLFDLFGMGAVSPGLGARAAKAASVRGDLDFTLTAAKPESIGHTPLDNLHYESDAPLDDNQGILLAMTAAKQAHVDLAKVHLLQPDPTGEAKRTLEAVKAEATVNKVQTVGEVEAYLSQVRPEEWPEE